MFTCNVGCQHRKWTSSLLCPSLVLVPVASSRTRQIVLGQQDSSQAHSRTAISHPASRRPLMSGPCRRRSTVPSGRQWVSMGVQWVPVGASGCQQVHRRWVRPNIAALRAHVHHQTVNAWQRMYLNLPRVNGMWVGSQYLASSLVVP